MHDRHPLIRRARLIALLASMALGQAQGADIPAPTGFAPRVTSTLEKLLPLAYAGDAEIQNFVGFMYFYGEGVERDFEEAHIWFHESAERGNVNAQLNLGLLHGGSLPQVPAEYKDLGEAATWLQRAAANGAAGSVAQGTAIRKGDVNVGEKVYSTFCSGCHGINGIATRPDTPSFARGERMTKPDHDLAHSVANGVNSMPPWGTTLSRELLDASLAYIRASYERTGSTQGAVGWPPPVDTGGGAGSARDYRTYCAGCHGFNGVSYYVNSPSFAFGERLDKSDADLYRSIAKGIGVMPSWEMMLTAEQISGMVNFIRKLNEAYRSGIAAEMGAPPPYYFRFRPLGATGNEWLGADPAGAPPPSR